MANNLSTPLPGRKRQHSAKRRFNLPVARVLGGVLLLVVGGVAARVLLVDDPQGGRPSQEVAIDTTRNANSVANAVATGPVTITADPEQYPIGTAIPTDDPAPQATASALGPLPDLSEETADGPIPRMSATGETPFAAYRGASAAAADQPTISVIVTGLGINEQGSLDAIDRLPQQATLGFVPYGKTLPTTVAAARGKGHEVILEVPLEPFDYPQNDPGPQTLLTGDPTRANLDKLFWLMARFGAYPAVVNNMGARFTASAADFSPIMEELGARGLGYLDDGSSNRSLAPQLADANKVPYARVDLVIDANPSAAAIAAALAQLEQKARETGHAIGIASALPISVAAVAEWSGTLPDKGLALVPVTAQMQ